MRNIHFHQAGAESISSVYDDASPAELSPAPLPAKPEDVRMKLREVSVSPAEEYALRAGTVQPIADSFAAMILSRSGRVEVTLKGVVVERNKVRTTYWHPDSLVCSDLSFRSRKIFYVLNIHRPDVVHLLSEDGTYLESLPAREKPAVLDNHAQELEARKNHRAIARAAEHLQRLHADDTAEALAALRHNAEETRRVVQTLPAPGSAAAAPVQAAHSPLGETVAAAERDVIAGTANYDRTPVPPPPSRQAPARHTDDSTETASAILARRSRVEVECPY